MPAGVQGRTTGGARARRGSAGDPVVTVARAGVMGLAPGLILVSHFFFGAALNLPALVMFASLCACLAAALCVPSWRGDLAEIGPVWLPLGLFLGVLGVAALTLTSAVPGGAHPIWAWAGLPGASTLNRSATTLEMIKLLGLAATFVLGCLLGARTERARRAFSLLLWLGGAYALISLVLFLSGAQLAGGHGRLGGGFYSANVAGTQFGVLVLMATAWSVRQWNQGRSGDLVARLTDMAPVLALLLLFLLCLFLTASRGGISATVLALALFLGWSAFDNRQARWPLMIVGVLIILIAALVLIQGNGLFADRFGDIGAGDATRSTVAQAHWRAFLASPLFGYGLGSYPEVNNQIMTAQNAAALSVSVVQHNAYLQWLEEAGIVGAAPMFVLIAVILGFTAGRAVRRPRNRTLVAGLLAASVVVLLHAAVDVSLNTPSFEAFWTLILGLGFALSQASSRPR